MKRRARRLEHRRIHIQRRILSLGLIAILAAFQLSALAAGRRNGRDVRFTVRIENISTKDGFTASNGARFPFALSPGMWVVHGKLDVRLLKEGGKASVNGLEMQAEDGNPEGLVRYLERYHNHMLHGVFNTPVGASSSRVSGGTATQRSSKSTSKVPGQTNNRPARMTSAAGEDAIDGIKVDQAGNLYVSGPGGLWVISPEGKHLGTIIAPKHPHNMAWGDEDGKTLYLCARSGLYQMRLNVSGVRPAQMAVR